MKKQTKPKKVTRKKKTTISKKRHNKKNRKKLIAIIVIGIVFIIGSIAAAIIIPREIEKNERIETSNKLHDCLKSGYNRIVPGADASSGEVQAKLFVEPNSDVEALFGGVMEMEENSEVYEMAISCYDKYHVADYQTSISTLKSYKKAADLSRCVKTAEKNSEITDEELQRAKYDNALAIALITRIGNGYQEEINCYEKYGTSADDSRVIELRSKKAENDSYLESAKSTMISTPSNETGNYSTHCATHAIGNYVYTDCY